MFEEQTHLQFGMCLPFTFGTDLNVVARNEIQEKWREGRSNRSEGSSKVNLVAQYKIFPLVGYRERERI